MRVSEIDEDYLVNYLKLDEPDDDDIKFAQTCLDAAKSFIRGRQVLMTNRLMHTKILRLQYWYSHRICMIIVGCMSKKAM